MNNGRKRLITKTTVPQGMSRKGCRFYKNEDIHKGCIALNKLYCKIENKYCKFYKPKIEEKTGGK